MTELSQETFDEEISRPGLTVVDFWAPWCGPCRMMAPVLTAVSGEQPDVAFAKVNVDENGELAAKFGVMSIPTLVFFRAGAEVARSVGLLTKPALLGKIAEANAN